AGGPASGERLPHGPRRRAAVAGDGRLPRPGHRPLAGKGTGETTLLRQMYASLSPGDVVLADALFDNYFLACELRERGNELVARVQAERVGSRTVEARPDGDIIIWRRPNKPRGMTGAEYRRDPKELRVRPAAA